MKNLKCCKCKKELFQKIDNKIKIRTNIIVFEKAEGGENIESPSAVIKCQYCKEDNEVPILLDIKNADIKHLIFEK
jgi:hypothetical protein